MSKTPKHKEARPAEEDEDAIMERTKEALRRALNTPHETHKEMVERRRGGKRLTNPKAKRET